MILGHRISQVRKSKGVKQSFIAQKLGKTPQWLSAIEAGRRGIDATELNEIAIILGVTIDIFFGEELNKELSSRDGLTATSAK